MCTCCFVWPLALQGKQAAFDECSFFSCFLMLEFDASSSLRCFCQQYFCDGTAFWQIPLILGGT